ncbi:Bacillopeptidase F [Folsomia candida]|uniref:Bacillopeptidase F n=1 Tax=Folsomia candida TaxID=158441 RepID=A0A226F423_FOLCA|nr:Bacillopeptidase F [Folsomia candida]
MLRILIISLGILGIQGMESKIDFSLLESSEPADILISFGQIPSSIYRSNNARISRTNHISNMVSSLKSHSSDSQNDVTDFLQKERIPFEQLWITNQIVIKRCSQGIMRKLSEFPLVSRISEDVHYPLDEPQFPVQVSGTKIGDTPEWGISMVKAPEANSLLSEVLGSDDGTVDLPEIRVVVIDTGILHTHEAVRNNFLGTYGWYDPSNGRLDPYDDNGHGTHVTALIACGQFAVCPHLSDGSSPNCSYAASVVSNSWNGGQGQTWFDPVIEAWHSAGIIPVVSSGNTGPPCGTVSSPADRNVIAVGSTTNIDSISYFSAVGPSVFGEVKPDLTAPGHDVVSAWITGNTAYAMASGTSMACPHATGLIALLLAYKPDLTYAQVKEALFGGADTANLVASGRNCGGINESEFPNNVYGHGRINALESLKALIEAYPITTEPPTEEPTTEPPTEEPTTEPPTEEPTTEPPTEEPITEEPPTTPTPGNGCVHGPFWFPDEVNVPNLICICQSSCSSQYSYNCLTAANP